MSKRRDAMKEMMEPIVRTATIEQRPMLKPVVQSGALKSMNLAFESLSHEAEEAGVLREQLASGQSIVELDARDIEPSFVRDRLDGFESQDFDELMASISEHGQLLPVLVRPKPAEPGRYQIAFGHRRVEATRRLGIPVKAIVRKLSDNDLIVAQGKENLERRDLSFIERGLFAARLEDRGVGRDVILAALSTHKGNLSTMISLVRRLPEELVIAVGAAPKIGRPRWESLASNLERDAHGWKSIVNRQGFAGLSSDERFEAVLSATTATIIKDKPKELKGKNGSVFGHASVSSTKVKLVFDQKAAPEFGAYLVAHLPDLYQSFLERDND
ncbi:plasmid partitioning protein RepB [Agrobacterium tumefaciens]|uniref:plasmid partitioning protein RepB n=1 Tax=Agrobacterium tumefaciens TaxID=358 RepID=UPI0012B980E2|nr:plasmid partitioning protein RepB [Agrobacterium tumefaciens]MQB07175.1 plasmid partitioning protein RepB [Agrobacterium tumefaciens]